VLKLAFGEETIAAHKYLIDYPSSDCLKTAAQMCMHMHRLRERERETSIGGGKQAV
jgi:hypothetical protein